MGQQIKPLNEAEHKWIQENVNRFKCLLNKESGGKINLYELDEAFSNWMRSHDAEKEDPNPMINMFGIVFGHYIIDDIGLEWVIVSDDIGTDLAVHGESGSVLIYPLSFVAKRYVNKQTGFFSLFYPEIKKDVERFRIQKSS